jgi:hypothetical protein
MQAPGLGLRPGTGDGLAGRRRGVPGTNLVPDQLRPRPFPWPIAATAALAAAGAALAWPPPAVTAIREERRLAALDRAVARIAPDVRQVEQVASAVEQGASRGGDAPRVPGRTPPGAAGAARVD